MSGYTYQCTNYEPHEAHDETKTEYVPAARGWGEVTRQCVGREDLYTDAYLTEQYEVWAANGMGLTAKDPVTGKVVGRGTALVAQVLLEAPYEVRKALYQEACTMTNYDGGVISQATRTALRTWQATGKFPYGDRAKAHLKAENELNAALRAKDPGAPWVILPMN